MAISPKSKTHSSPYTDHLCIAGPTVRKSLLKHVQAGPSEPFVGRIWRLVDVCRPVIDMERMRRLSKRKHESEVSKIEDLRIMWICEYRTSTVLVE